MVTKQYIVCDACGFKWKIKKQKLKTIEMRLNPLQPPMEVAYFKCGKCGKVYIAYIIDNVAKDLMGARDKLLAQHRELDGTGKSEEADYIYNGVKIRNTQIKTHMERLLLLYGERCTLQLENN